MQIILSILQFIVGLALILQGADWLTDGGAGIARRFGIPQIVIGLTIVAFGTSAPEFIVSFMAALSGQTDMAVGNVVGSNIFNILGIIGITALFKPIAATKGNIRNDVPFCLLASLILTIMASDTLLDGDSSRMDALTRSDGMLLLCFFCIFMFYTFSLVGKSKKNAEEDAFVAKEKVHEQTKFSWKESTWAQAGMILLGLAGLIFGGDWMVSGASDIARFMGVSEAIIALTIVSLGTSAPELAASVIAARKGYSDLAMGNVVGSCIFNAFWVLGVSALVCPLTINSVTEIDFAVLLGGSILFWLCCKFGKTYHEITRTDGALMTVSVVLYYVYLVVTEVGVRL